MAFTASTRDVMKTLGVMDAKTLHRRREDYNDKSVNPDSQFLKLGVHFLRKSPSSKQLVWDLDTTVRAWVEATKVQPQPTATERAFWGD